MYEATASAVHRRPQTWENTRKVLQLAQASDLELGNCEIHIREHSMRVYDGEHWREVSNVSDAVDIVVGERARMRRTGGMKAHILQTEGEDVR